MPGGELEVGAIDFAFGKVAGICRILKYPDNPAMVPNLYVGASKGCLLIDTTNAKLYINTGTHISPIWTLVGSQT